MGCGKLISAMATLLGDDLSKVSYDTPMASDALTRIRDPVDAVTNPLMPHVPAARAILGLGLFITRGVRTDALFPVIALSPYVVNHLTLYVWNALLRWANYLVQTKDITLILNPPLKPSDFAACSDSSLINGPVTSVSMPDIAAASYGGSPCSSLDRVHFQSSASRLVDWLIAAPDPNSSWPRGLASRL